MDEKRIEDRVIGALVGLACGDAVGTTLEFKARGSFIPIDNMVGGGPFRLHKGEWTDDTSMALCLGYSLYEQKGFDARDQMTRYLKWQHEGYMSSNGACFDIGMTVSNALLNYEDSLEPFSGPTAPRTSGNGSIMRLAPVPIFYAHDLPLCIEMSAQSSRTTHGSEQCIDACKLFAQLIVKGFFANTKEQIFSNLDNLEYCSELSHILDGSFISMSYEDIRGSGYVVESLTAALWCFYHADTFKEAILLAANLGDDADTTAAVCGQIAGAFYGLGGIPEDWHRSIVMEFEIKHLARQLYREGSRLTLS